GLAELPVQYSDFSRWQRQWLQGEVLDAQLAYWTDQLAAAPAVLSLPTDRPRPAVQTFSGAHYHWTLNAALLGQIKAYCLSQGVTLFMFMLAVYQTVLSRHSQQLDICVGSPIAGRNRLETEGLIGFFVNGIVLRANFKQNPGFQQLLQQLKGVTLAAYAHQDLPFEVLVNALQPTRNLAYAPLAQVGFTVQNMAQTRYQATDLELSAIDGEYALSKYDMTLSLAEQDGELQGVVEYNTDLFDAARVARFMHHMEALLEVVLVDDQVPLSVVPLESLQGLPLTTMQRDLYLESVLHPDTRFNSLGYALEIDEALDLNRWRGAIEDLLAGQSVLRMRLVGEEEPFQELARLVDRPGWMPALEVLDWSAENLDAVRLEQRIQDLIYRPYDLPQDELSHYGVIKLAEAHFVVFLAVHHLLLDGVAATEHLQQLGALYALSEDIPVLSDTFDSYVSLHREQFDRQEVNAFWQQQFASVEALTMPLSSGQFGAGELIERVVEP
ncbi:MAG TPA: hypothetical protein EYO58_10400, partial [Flavobacteriales bacterium]|nr:hypothetical protein [Flavobacteriales bacterium]